MGAGWQWGRSCRRCPAATVAWGGAAPKPAPPPWQPTRYPRPAPWRSPARRSRSQRVATRYPCRSPARRSRSQRVATRYPCRSPARRSRAQRVATRYPCRSPARRSRAQRVATRYPCPPPQRRTRCGRGAESSVLAQPGPQPESDRDGRAQAEHDTPDRRAGQPAARVEDVVAQLVATLLHRLTQGTVELVEGGGGGVLPAISRALGG